MNESLRLGRIAGVSVGINWSVLVIFALITFGLAAGRFPLEYPGLPPVAYLAAGLVTAVVFFGSLLAHEVAHAVVARRNGLEVDGITLWLFGGVARLGGEAADPGAELRIAGVGPVVSLVLGGAFYLLALATAAAGAEGIAVGALGWLALINIVLAVFNLVPAAPLDGGRILRALLWKRHGNRYRASITAARAGRVFGFTLVGLGLLEIVATAGLGGLWLVLVGWFLLTAAAAEEQHARIRSMLGDVPVAEVMSPDPATAPESLTVQDFIDDYVFSHRYSTFPLTSDAGRPAGLVTLNRVKHVPAGQRAGTAVRDIACPAGEVPVVGPDESLADLLPKLSECADGRAIVVDDGRIIGIVSPTDIARRLESADLRDTREAQHI